MEQQTNAVLYDIFMQLVEGNRPSNRFKPMLSCFGDRYYAELRDHRHYEIVMGVGPTPEKAMIAFDRAWRSGKPETEK